MHALADFYPELFRIAVALLAAIALTPLARRLALPPPAAFLVVGMAAGLWDLIPIDTLGELRLEQIGVLALYAVLFQGGLATGFRVWRIQAWPILLLGTAGTALTAAALACIGHYLLGLGWALAALVGIALSPTDPAAVYSLLRGNRTGSLRARTILEGESGFNDPVSIALAVAAVAFLASDRATVGDAVVHVVEEIAIGTVGGVIGGGLLIAFLRISRHLEESLQAVSILAIAVAIGAATASLHGSGFLAVYLAGLLVADEWTTQDGRHHAIPEAVAAAAEPVLFGLLGAVFVTRVGGIDIVHGLALTLATIIVLRPAVVALCLLRTRLSANERMIVSVGGLKGAVPLLLAAYPALASLPEARRTEAIVLTATAASIALQSWGVALISTGSRGDDHRGRMP